MSNEQVKANSGKEDEELIGLFLKGNEEAFNRLVLKYKEKAYFLALRILGNHHDAEEASQEAFIKAYRALRKLRERKYFFTWLYRITYNVCMSRKKAVKFTESLDSAAELRDTTSGLGEESVEKEQLKQAVREMIGILPRRQRAVFVMRIYDEMKFEEIAAAAGLTTGGAKANFFNAVKKIKNGMREKYGLQKD